MEKKRLVYELMNGTWDLDLLPVPGHMGCEQVTVQNLDVVKVDTEHSLIAVKGAVPGARNGIVVIRDSVKA